METVSTWSTEPPQPHCFEFQVCNFGQVTSPNPFTYLPPVRIHTYLLWELNEIMHQGWDMKHCKCPQFNCCLPSQLACAGDWIICSPVCPAAELPLLEPSPESCPSAVLGTCRLTDSHFYCEQKKKKNKKIFWLVSVILQWGSHTVGAAHTNTSIHIDQWLSVSTFSGGTRACRSHISHSGHSLHPMRQCPFDTSGYSRGSSWQKDPHCHLHKHLLA